MVSIPKYIGGFSIRSYSTGNAGNRETKGQNPGTGIQNPASSIQNPVSSIQYRTYGFTLLEVMVSVAIMSIVLVSVYRLHSQSLAMNAEARFYTQAPMLAQSKLSEMGAGQDDEFTSTSGEFGDNFPGYTWSVSVDDVEIEALGEISQDLKRIDVTVSFNENEYVYNLRTFRLVRE
jgi:general secretion pathway protein I